MTSTDFSLVEAKNIAKARWGTKADAWFSGINAECYVCSFHGPNNIVGRGATFMKAFQDAEVKEAKLVTELAKS